MPNRHSKKLVGEEGDFSAVASLDLAHDVADVNFDGTLAHIELVGDDLIGLTLAQAINHLELFRGEMARSSLAACIHFGNRGRIV